MTQVRFPDTIANGATGGPGFKTVITTMLSGGEARGANWRIARGQWDVSQATKIEADMDVLLQFFYGHAGRAQGFRFKDWQDFRVPFWTNAPGDLDAIPTFFTTDGATRPFQVTKAYEDAAGTYTRPITRIVPGSLVLFDGSDVTTDYAVDVDTGIVTLGTTLAATTGHAIAGYCEFDCWVRFDIDQMKIEYVDQSADQGGIFTWSGISLIELRSDG